MKQLRPSRWLLPGAALVVAMACPSKDQPPPVDAADPFLKKLQAAPAPPRPLDQDALAQAAQGKTPPTTLTPPSDAGAQVGPVAARIIGLELSQHVQGRRMALSTADAFLRVTLDARGPGSVDAAAATLRRGASVFPVARDVMRLVGSPVTVVALDGGTNELRLYFELPAAEVTAGLELALPAESGELQLRVQ